MPLSPFEFESILHQRGILSNDAQIRPLTRDDIETLVEQNGGSLGLLHLRGLDFTGADLRGLKLENAYLEGCDFKDVLLIPMVISYGKRLAATDGAYPGILKMWADGNPAENTTVIHTSLKGSLLTQSNFSGCDLSWTNLSETLLGSANFENAILFGADLSDTHLRGTNFRNADLRNSSLRAAKLDGVRLETTQLDGIEWGKNYKVQEELDKNFKIAEQIYRTLKRVHVNAGLANVAGEFHFRENSSRRKSLFLSGWRDLFYWVIACLMQLLFGYGERPWHIVIIGVVVVFVFSFIFLEPSPFDVSSAGLIEFFDRFPSAVYFSAASFTALGYGEWVDVPTIRFKNLGVIESFIGVSLLALLLVTITRKWTR